MEKNLLRPPKVTISLLLKRLQSHALRESANMNKSFVRLVGKVISLKEKQRLVVVVSVKDVDYD